MGMTYLNKQSLEQRYVFDLAPMNRYVYHSQQHYVDRILDGNQFDPVTFWQYKFAKRGTCNLKYYHAPNGMSQIDQQVQIRHSLSRLTYMLVDLHLLHWSMFEALDLASLKVFQVYLTIKE